MEDAVRYDIYGYVDAIGTAYSNNGEWSTFYNSKIYPPLITFANPDCNSGCKTCGSGTYSKIQFDNYS